MPIEQEVKLSFESAAAARQAILAADGRLDVPRRLLVDKLFDSPDHRLRDRRCALRVRRDGDRAFVTFKGPVMDGPVKSREEIETAVGSGDVAEALVRALGFDVWFRAEKFREEYVCPGDARVTIDETPIGVFVEIEAAPPEIEQVARRLGKTPRDYRLESYPRLYADWCAAHGLSFGNMTFDTERR